MLVAGLDWINITLHGERYPYLDAFNLETFFANLMMLPNFPHFRRYTLFSHTVFGSARPLWTLPIEWYCYLVFGLFAYGFSKYRKNPFFWIFVCFWGIVPYHNFIWGINNGLTFTWLMGIAVCIALVSAGGRMCCKRQQIEFCYPDSSSGFNSGANPKGPYSLSKS